MDESRRKNVKTRFNNQPITRREGSRETASPLLYAMTKKILICFVVLLLFSIGYAQEKASEIPLDGSPSMGPADAPVTIIEFIDFQ